MAKPKKPAETETIISPEGEPQVVEASKSTYVEPDPKLKAAIDEAKEELSKTKPVTAEKTVGTWNLLTLNLKIRGAFRIVYGLLVLATLSVSAYLVYTNKIPYRQRLNLVPEALKAFGLLVPSYWANIISDVKTIAAVFGGAIVLLLCWLWGHRSIIATLVTRLAMLAFWLVASYWLYSVLGLGQTVPQYIF